MQGISAQMFNLSLHIREIKCNQIVILAYSTSTNEVKLDKNTQRPDIFVINLQDMQK